MWTRLFRPFYPRRRDYRIIGLRSLQLCCVCRHCSHSNSSSFHPASPRSQDITPTQNVSNSPPTSLWNPLPFAQLHVWTATKPPSTCFLDHHQVTTCCVQFSTSLTYQSARNFKAGQFCSWHVQASLQPGFSILEKLQINYFSTKGGTNRFIWSSIASRGRQQASSLITNSRNFRLNYLEKLK